MSVCPCCRLPFTVLSKKIDTSAITWQYTALGPSGNPIPNGANQAEIAVGKQIAYQLFGTLDSHGAVTNKLEIKRNPSGNVVGSISTRMTLPSLYSSFVVLGS